MGQKTHPIGFRLGIIRTWNSRWYAPNSKVADFLHEDLLVKRYIGRRLENAGIAKIFIARAPRKVSVDIHTSRPGIVIGRKGAEVDKLRDELRLLTGKDIVLNIVEVRKSELDATLVADSIARQLEGRVSFRRAMKKALAATMKMGAVGIKVQCAGRLGGADIARTEKYRAGRVPLHTLRADIDYMTSTAHTTYGCIGVKVWICRGEVMGRGHFVGEPERQSETDQSSQPPSMHRRKDRKPRGGKRPRGRVRKAGVSEESQRGRRPEASSKPERDSRREDKAEAKAPRKETSGKKSEAGKSKPKGTGGPAKKKTDKE